MLNPKRRIKGRKSILSALTASLAIAGYTAAFHIHADSERLHQANEQSGPDTRVIDIINQEYKAEYLQKAQRVAKQQSVCTDENCDAELTELSENTVTQKTNGTVRGTMPGQFEVNKHGAATYTMPIEVPPGINGLQPELAIVYNSQTGNTNLGVGTNLSGSDFISRCGTNYFEDNQLSKAISLDDSDKLCMGNSKLHLVSGSYGKGGSVYHLEPDNRVKVIAHGSTSEEPQFFEVVSNNKRRFYGGWPGYSSTAAGALKNNDGAATLQWMLSRTEDQFGNNISYFYEANKEEGTSRLSQIEYNNNGAVVSFVYEGRSDGSTSYVAGSSMRKDKRLKAINTAVVENGVMNDVLTYEFDYASLPPFGDNRSRLGAVSKCAGGTCFTSTTFEWEISGYGFDIHQPPQDGLITEIPNNVEDAEAELARYKRADFNGDGLTDIMKLRYTTSVSNGRKPMVYLAKPDGTYANGILAEPVLSAAHINSPNLLKHLQYARTQLVDINSDGFADIYHFEHHYAGNVLQQDSIYYGRGDGTFEQKQLGAVTDIGCMSDCTGWGSDAILRSRLAKLSLYNFGDFDGNGYQDVLQINANSADTIHFNTGKFGPFPGFFFSKSHGPEIPLAQTQEQAWANMVIQGRAAQNPHTNVVPYISAQEAAGGGAITIHGMDNSPGAVQDSRIPDMPKHALPGTLANQSRYRLADFDGDGKTDIMLLSGFKTIKDIEELPHHAAQRIYFSKYDLANNKEGFEIVRSIPILFSDEDASPYGTFDPMPVAPYARVQTGDFNGDGMADLFIGESQKYLDIYAEKMGLNAQSHWNQELDSQICLSKGDGGFDCHKANVPEVPLLGRARITNPDDDSEEIPFYYQNTLSASLRKFGDFNGDGITDIYHVNTSFGNDIVADSIYYLGADGKVKSIGHGIDSFVPLSKIKEFPFTPGQDLGQYWHFLDLFEINTENLDREYAKRVRAVTFDLSRLNFVQADDDNLLDVYVYKGWNSTSTDHIHLNTNVEPIVTKIIDGLGHKTEIEYATLHDDEVYLGSTFNLAAPLYGGTFGEIYAGLNYFKGGTKVVKRFQTPDGLGGWNGQRMQYGGLKRHFALGNLGFETIKRIDEAHERVNVFEYSQEYPKVGVLLSNQNYYDKNLDDYNKIFLSLIINKWQVSNSHWGTRLLLNTATDTYEYETNGSLIGHTTETRNYDGHGLLKNSLTDTHDGFMDYSEFRYDIDHGNWLFSVIEEHKTRQTYGVSDTKQQKVLREYTSAPAGFGSVLLSETSEWLDQHGQKQQLVNEYQFDNFGNTISLMISGNGFNSRTTQFEYSPNGLFNAKVTNAKGHVKHKIHEARFGNLMSETDAIGNVTSYDYDNFGRPIHHTDFAGISSNFQYGYDMLGLSQPQNTAYIKSAQTLGSGPQVSYFDILGREIRAATRDAYGKLVYVDKIYNSKGQLIEKTLPYYPTQVGASNASRLRFEYDSLGRTKRVYENNRQIAYYNYKGLTPLQSNGLIATIPFTVATESIDAYSNKTLEIRDARGQVVQIIDEQGNPLTTLFDAFGNPTRITDVMGNVTEIDFDNGGHQYRLNDPDMGEWRYDYNALGELVTEVDSKGQTTQFVYDQLGRNTLVFREDGITSNVYDMTPDSYGNLSWKMKLDNGQNVVWKQDFLYDGLGRVAETQVNYKGKDYIIKTTYDNLSRTKSLTYPTGFTVVHDYHSDGGLMNVRNSNTNKYYWQYLHSEADGVFSHYKTGDGHYFTYKQLDPFKRLINRIQVTKGVSEFLYDEQYAYDALGNLLTKSDNISNVFEQMEYDTLGRLTRHSSHDFNDFGRSYLTDLDYDAVGNIVFKTGVGNYDYVGAKNVTGGAHAVKSINHNGVQTHYSYDQNGNMLHAGNKNFSYTSFNKVAEVVGVAGRRMFEYDANNQKVYGEKSKNGSLQEITTYIGGIYEQEESFVNETGVSNFLKTVTNKFYVSSPVGVVAVEERSEVHLNNGMRMANPDTTMYWFKDSSDSNRLIINTLATKADDPISVNRLRFDAHGKRVDNLGGQFLPGSADETDYGYTGQEHMDDLGLINYSARVYDPVIGRFTSPDIFIQDPSDMQNYNRYSYVVNNPFKFTDPTGHFHYGGWDFYIDSNGNVTSKENDLSDDRVFFMGVELTLPPESVINPYSDGWPALRYPGLVVTRDGIDYEWKPTGEDSGTWKRLETVTIVADVRDKGIADIINDKLTRYKYNNHDEFIVFSNGMEIFGKELGAIVYNQNPLTKFLPFEGPSTQTHAGKFIETTVGIVAGSATTGKGFELLNSISDVGDYVSIVPKNVKISNSNVGDTWETDFAMSDREKYYWEMLDVALTAGKGVGTGDYAGTIHSFAQKSAKESIKIIEEENQ